MNPSAASSAASNPLRGQCPTCSGLVMVPKFALMPEANDAASPSATAVWSAGSPSRWQHAAVGAEHAERRGRMPALFVMMEIDAARDARLGFETGDKAAMNARPSTPRVSASANSAGRIGADGWPPSVLLTIVEVQRVRRGAVDQRRIQRRRRCGGAEDQARAAGRPRSSRDRRCARRARSRRPACSRRCRGSRRVPSAPPHPASAS